MAINLRIFLALLLYTIGCIAFGLGLALLYYHNKYENIEETEELLNNDELELRKHYLNEIHEITTKIRTYDTYLRLGQVTLPEYQDVLKECNEKLETLERGIYGTNS